ncbi:hypothetical protein Anapl_08110 [Anas platyrhynchos]|uniref:Uncharacterized protein n=1 Tax=Anas platyrhynchos TaxID=8839 RepID=R0LSX9_ANAPL|nr:hypothetical protein Anapl_08110 [Anas platyrhynchos]
MASPPPLKAAAVPESSLPQSQDRAVAQQLLPGTRVKGEAVVSAGRGIGNLSASSVRPYLADLFSEISTGTGILHSFADVLPQIAVTQQSTEPVLPRQCPSEIALQSSLLGSFVFINVLPRFACITSFLQQI